MGKLIGKSSTKYTKYQAFCTDGTALPNPAASFLTGTTGGLGSATGDAGSFDDCRRERV